MGIRCKGIVEVISSINRDLSFKATKYFEELGISKVESVYILIIEGNPGITQYELAKYMRCSKTLVVKHIKKIEDKGIVKKVDDAQKKRLHLTETGKDIAQNVHDCLNETTDAMFDGISEEDVEKVLEISKKVKKNLQEHVARDLFNNISFKL